MAVQPHRLISAARTTAAEFVPDAGMLCSSLTYAGEELLDPGKGFEAYAARGATMGVPLLYPWANRLDGFHYEAAGRPVTLPEDRARIPVDPNGLPIHGLVPGMMRWAVQSQADESALSATLSWSNPELLELFPYPHEVAMDVVARDDAVTWTMIVRAGEQSVPVSFGFHPYLRLPSGGRNAWRVELPAMERLALDERMIPTGARTPLTPSERSFVLAGTSWDDGFAALEAPARFAVSDGTLEIALELLEGYPFAQIYAPPAHDFICFEPMTAPTNALRSGDGLPIVAPGEEYRAAFRVSVVRT